MDEIVRQWGKLTGLERHSFLTRVRASGQPLNPKHSCNPMAAEYRIRRYSAEASERRCARKENEQLKTEIDEALGLAQWCDSTNNHGRDSIVDLVKHLLHLHKVLVDDSVEQDKENTKLKAQLAAKSGE